MGIKKKKRSVIYKKKRNLKFLIFLWSYIERKLKEGIKKKVRAMMIIIVVNHNDNEDDDDI